MSVIIRPMLKRMMQKQEPIVVGQQEPTVTAGVCDECKQSGLPRKMGTTPAYSDVRTKVGPFCTFLCCCRVARGCGWCVRPSSAKWRPAV